MILLDTNVLSEVMRARPEPRVLDWLDAQDAAAIWISAVTWAEIELGVASLPAGKRRDALAAAAHAMLRERFAQRCLAFDARAASHYARIVASRTRAGRPITVEDAQIAAIALSHDATLATRNGRDFSGIDGLDLVDPWQAGHTP